MSSLPHDQLLIYFNASDKDKSGFIDAFELQQCLSNGTWKPFNIETVRLMIRLFDKNMKGTINFQDFNGLWTYITKWQASFSAYDKDKTLTLSPTQLHESLTNSGYPVSLDLLKTMISKFNDSGAYVDFDDYIHVCILIQKISKSFNKLDKDKDGVATITYEQFLAVSFELVAPSAPTHTHSRPPSVTSI